jgi:type IV secretory pathway VirB10-like protein
MNVERPGDGRTSDPAVDRAWRIASNEEPPQQLDAEILSAARSRRPRLRAWQPLAAVATVAAFAFLLLQLMPRERNVEAPISIETVPSPPTEPALREEAKTTAEPAAPSVAAVSPPVVATERAAAPRQSERTPDVAAPPNRQEARDSAGLTETSSKAAESSAEAIAGNAMRPAAPEPAPGTSPAQWSAQVDRLYRSGDIGAAERQLRAFRAAYADADQYLPQELRDWASSIK